MTKIRVDLSETGCQKPNCKRRFKKPHRHHKGNEKLFIAQWEDFGPPDRNYEILRSLQRRYLLFRPQDIVVVCAWHHAEIHRLYNDLMYQDQLMRQKLLFNYSIRDAISLMRILRRECDEWMKVETPGVRPPIVFRAKI